MLTLLLAGHLLRAEELGVSEKKITQIQIPRSARELPGFQLQAEGAPVTLPVNCETGRL